MPSSLSERQGFSLVTGVTVFCVMATHLTRPMVSYEALRIGASPLEVGLVQSSYSLIPVFTAIAIGGWIDRRGAPRVLLVGCVALLFGSAGLLIPPTLVSLAAALSIMGFGLVGTAISGQSWIANVVPPDRRVHRFGWFAAALSVGQMAGPMLAAVIAQSGTDSDTSTAFVLGTALMFAPVGLSGLLAARSTPADAPPAPKRRILLQEVRTIIRRPGIAPALFLSIAVAAVMDVFLAYLPVYGEETGLSIATVGLLLGVRGGASLLSRAFMGSLNDWLGIRKLLTLSTGLAALAVCALLFARSTPVLLALMTVVGLGLGIGQPLSIALIAERIPSNQRGLALGIRLTGNLGAVLIAPTLMGLVATVFGVRAIWPVLAVILAAGAVVEWGADDQPVPLGDPS